MKLTLPFIFRNSKCIKYLSAECQNLDFMHRFKTDNISKILTELIKKRKQASIQQSFQKAALPQNHFPYIIWNTAFRFEGKKLWNQFL